MINNKLKPYIHNVIIHFEGAVAIDLFFKYDFKFRIISVYLSTSNKSHRDSAQEKAILWIQQALSSNLLPVVLGDFNTSTIFTLLTYETYRKNTKTLITFDSPVRIG